MLATLFLIFGEIWRGIWRGLTAIAQLLYDSAIARYIAVGLLGAVLVLVIFTARACKSTTDPLDPVITETQQNVNHAIDKLVNVNANVKDAEANTNKARENLNRIKPETNVSIDVANKNRCRAYPSDPGC